MLPSWRQDLTRRLVRDGGRRLDLSRLGWGSRIALGWIVVLVLVAIFAPLIEPFSPTQTNAGPIATGPSLDHLMGTDQFGRDVFSRLIAGTRVSIAVGLGATLLALLLGALLGAFAATSHKLVDEGIMRFLDVFMAFPAVIIAVCVAAVTRAGVLTTTLVVAVIYTPQLARVVYANVREQLGEDYVAAASVMGSGKVRVVVRHVAVNCAVPVLVFTATIVADAIVLESTLSFIGVGIQPPTASWGNVVAEGKDLMYTGGWWVTTFGGLTIFAAVLALNVLAEGLTDALSRPPRGAGEEAVDRQRLESWERPLDELLAAPERGALLQVDDLTVRFPDAYGPLPLLSAISFDVREGEVVGLVGESGCGKSLTGLAIMGLLPDGAEVSGSIRFQGRDLLQMAARERRALLGGEIAMIYQDALSSLNPGMTVRQQLRQVCRRGARRTPEQLLELVGLSSALLGSYPHQLSGGQRQRVLIALALARDPKLLVADEPTTALDETIQAQVVDLLRELQAELGFSVVLVSHDLALVAELADRVLVMYAGQLVEAGGARRVVEAPGHPYTDGLLGAIRSLEEGRERLAQIDGVVPPPAAFPSGCRFAGRCARETAECRVAAPPMLDNGDERFLACYHPVVPATREREAVTQ
ncbi:dipeptide/oligopeptide/nickel ABC transporter permease/ATP-binding protein [Conexibacter sp. JD483]|uniref:dipeptide/oligopeptide/nickel ABC transporter permease/ATP-binding protein n=1 Tax=unclassified Conexibacter TaxID=2627773 RepID=UPI002721AE4A|nr:MULTISPECIES: dipeptide/oligopeptide/nickel ABC transporter permease/ATP-binding protein [unclassified Conexibacter]MDO8187096.1 dipeptide/oligopeptide/nickel ABC transporter permease/ATP-binding protein [Conexibacter sp. CPCC 205706]MDO8200954.1 dipeptide/oligopeptide/nickel ABC transporter permease/ATP-binding protein [Conexibacter sp. CPCC 205762]MDR9371893.1 dipeptide/oligopeptide/nickel ABC transporter permease/ATP-binding protein [Conexibacter sp. JD483]